VLSAHKVKIVPSGYYAFKARPLSARLVSDRELLVEIERIFRDPELGRGCYGARKVWHQLRREGVEVARCTVERGIGARAHARHRGPSRVGASRIPRPTHGSWATGSTGDARALRRT
jgi:plasmid stabilization system protein ParE